MSCDLRRATPDGRAEPREPLRKLFRAGMELFAAEKFDPAAEEFTKATRADPLFTPAYYQAGQSYMNLQRYPSAIRAFQQCIESTRALYNLAQTDRFSRRKAARRRDS